MRTIMTKYRAFVSFLSASAAGGSFLCPGSELPSAVALALESVSRARARLPRAALLLVSVVFLGTSEASSARNAQPHRHARAASAHAYGCPMFPAGNALNRMVNRGGRPVRALFRTILKRLKFKA